jgi:beta-aspartyl-peptidase (threonine type)
MKKIAHRSKRARALSLTTALVVLITVGRLSAATQIEQGEGEAPAEPSARNAAAVQQELRPPRQHSSSRDAAEIRAVMAAQAAAWNRGDIDGFMDGYARSDATEFVAGDKLTRGWQTVRDRYRKKYDSREKMGALTFSELKITPLGGDAALVIGRWRLVVKNDKPHGRFTLLFRRTASGWRIVHDHTS